jgi:hypothetical protein
MHYTVYRITHLESGKVYVGKHQTEDLADGYMGSGNLIRRAVKKHGLEAFKKEILHVFETEEEMNAKEKELVTDEFCLREDTYNICPGGKGGWGYVNREGLGGTLGLSPSPAHRQKLSEATKRVFENDEFRALFSRKLSDRMNKHYQNGGQNGFLGKTHTDEFKRRMRDMHKTHNLKYDNCSGRIRVTNGIINKAVLPDEIPPGFVRGQTNKKKQVLLA